MNISDEQIIGRISALESIVCQLLTFHLVNNNEKDKILAILQEGISEISGKLSVVEKSHALDCANRIFQSARATALHLEGK
ncbi:MAG: hypothetical protein ABR955_04995 [Verrucomicrobiota bacterium]|jgi:amino acid permease